jgi:hypothetical protein
MDATALTRGAAGPGWHPIETAPLGEDVIVYSRRWGPVIAAFDSEFEEWLSRMQCPVSLRAKGEEPTHWMPLPRAPERELDRSDRTRETGRRSFSLAL